MHALVLDQKLDRLNASQIALMDAGLQVTGSGCIAVAETCIARMPVDILVVDHDTLGDALGDVIGSAEDRNEQLVSIMRSSNVASDMDSLAEAFPSLHAILGQTVSPDVVVHLGLASLHQQQMAARDEIVAAHIPSKILAQSPKFQRAPAVNAAAS